MSEQNILDAKRRAAEKAASRAKDELDLARGVKSQDDLRRENGAFAFPKVQIHFKKARRLA